MCSRSQGREAIVEALECRRMFSNGTSDNIIEARGAFASFRWLDDPANPISPATFVQIDAVTYTSKHNGVTIPPSLSVNVFKSDINADDPIILTHTSQFDLQVSPSLRQAHLTASLETSDTWDGHVIRIDVDVIWKSTDKRTEIVDGHSARYNVTAFGTVSIGTTNFTPVLTTSTQIRQNTIFLGANAPPLLSSASIADPVTSILVE
jgi:hypothetical protein